MGKLRTIPERNSGNKFILTQRNVISTQQPEKQKKTNPANKASLINTSGYNP